MSNTLINELLRFVGKIQKYLIHKKLLNKSYLQGMRRCSESEGISYQTSIMKIKKLLLRRKFKNKESLSENLKVLGLKAKN